MNRTAWLSATKTRNYLMGDPVLDWLNLHGAEHGFVRDDLRPGYDPRTDFSAFIMNKGIEFEAALVDVLKERVEIVELDRGRDLSDSERLERTKHVLSSGPEVVAQAFLAHGPSRTRGYPDLLVRSDVLQQLFPELLSTGEARRDAPGLDLAGRHYRIVDIKFTTLPLLVRGDVGSSSSSPAYKGQLQLYARALAELQGFFPDRAYLMGRGWTQTVKGTVHRGDDALERLGWVEVSPATKKGAALEASVDEALSWLRRLADHGRAWSIGDRPSVRELHPNMGNTMDAPWHAAKKEIAESIGELTTLWTVSAKKREAALDAGLESRDAVVSAAQVGVTGAKQGPTLDAILEVNRNASGPLVQPRVVRSRADIWAPRRPLEFFVDFETVNDLDDDFSALPRRGGSPLIFMIGCGHEENGQWVFREFTVDRLDPRSELEIIDAWIDHMDAVRHRRGYSETPLVFHWSNAEVSSLETAYNSASARHPARQWAPLRWFDLLKEVVRAEPVVVKGAWGFGLKAFATAMHKNGLIETAWSDGPTDGLGAMVGAWAAEREALAGGIPFCEHQLVREIAAYNEVDTRVMWEILAYLRNSNCQRSAKEALPAELVAAS